MRLTPPSSNVQFGLTIHPNNRLIKLWKNASKLKGDEADMVKFIDALAASKLNGDLWVEAKPKLYKKAARYFKLRLSGQVSEAMGGTTPIPFLQNMAIRRPHIFSKLPKRYQDEFIKSINT